MTERSEGPGYMILGISSCYMGLQSFGFAGCISATWDLDMVSSLDTLVRADTVNTMISTLHTPLFHFHHMLSASL